MSSKRRDKVELERPHRLEILGDAGEEEIFGLAHRAEGVSTRFEDEQKAE